eukprot:1143600-Pelagomonas_calceolata.AAC.1
MAHDGPCLDTALCIHSQGSVLVFQFKRAIESQGLVEPLVMQALSTIWCIHEAGHRQMTRSGAYGRPVIGGRQGTHPPPMCCSLIRLQKQEVISKNA